MKFTTIARLGGATALALSLAACMDVTMSIDIESESEAEATMVTAMSSDIYAMVQAQAPEGEDEFCAEGEVVETATTVECRLTDSGAFADIDLQSDEGGPRIESIGNGQVRVAFPAAELTDAVNEEAATEEDPQMMAMMSQMFEGHFVTLNVSGGNIVDTNMDLAEGGMSASYQIPFVDLLSGDLELPDEIYAVVQK